jgi:tRNA(fMet)-specific endonuclease VapC
LTLLDTNVVIHCLKGSEPITSRFIAATPSAIAIPSVVAYELEHGTWSIASARRRGFYPLASLEAAHVRLDLERRGIVIDPLDLLIAGTVLSRGATLATNNTREFSRIKSLRLEDWTLA